MASDIASPATLEKMIPVLTQAEKEELLRKKISSMSTTDDIPALRKDSPAYKHGLLMLEARKKRDREKRYVTALVAATVTELVVLQLCFSNSVVRITIFAMTNALLYLVVHFRLTEKVSAMLNFLLREVPQPMPERVIPGLVDPQDFRKSYPMSPPKNGIIKDIRDTGIMIKNDFGETVFRVWYGMDRWWVHRLYDRIRGAWASH